MDVIREAGNIKKRLKFINNVSAHMVMIMQNHNSVDSLKCYKLKILWCFGIYIFERGLPGIPGVDCILN